MRWLALFHFLIWCSMTGLWTWYTHMYAETVGGATPNATDYKVRVRVIFTSRKSDIWPQCSKVRWRNKRSGKNLDLFSSHIDDFKFSRHIAESLSTHFKGLDLTSENFLLRFTTSSKTTLKKLILQVFHCLLILGYVLFYVAPSKALFLGFTLIMAYSSIIICSAPFLLIGPGQKFQGFKLNRSTLFYW